ncbi:MAG: carboxypeptidase-like regulatory domain-containing protein [Planctomycetota bacterium]
MSDRGEASSPTFEENLARLLRVAPERARLDDVARRRVRDALRRASAPPPPRLAPKIGAVAALAAAVVLAVVGVRATIGGGEAERDVETASATPDAGSRTDSEAAVAPDRTATEDPELADLAPGEGPESAGLRRSGDVDAGADSGAGDSAAASDPPPPTDPNALNAAITFDPSLEERPSSLSVWVKPMVDLPRVADPVRYSVPLEEPVDGRATLGVAGAFGPARAQGAREVLVQLEAPGAAPARAVVPLEGVPDAVAFTLEAGETVRGYVVDERTGTPLEGAVVVAIDQLPLDGIPVGQRSIERFPKPSTTTDANGAFTLEHVAGPAKARIRASHPQFAPAVLTANLGDPQAEPLRIALPQGATVRGVCERDDGTRWNGAVVIASRQSGDPTARIRPPMTFGNAVTDETGAYDIGHLPPGPYVVLLFGEPESTAAGPLAYKQIVLRGEEEVEIDFLASASAVGASLSGRLVHAGGEPIGGVTLTLIPIKGGTTSRTEWSATETDADGSFTISDLADGPHVLYRASNSFGRMELMWQGVLEGPTERTIVVEPTEWTLACRSEDGLPRAGAWAILERRDDSSDDWAFGGRAPTVADGRVAFEGLPPGRYRATITSVDPDDGHRVIDPVALVAAAPLVTEVTLPSGSTVVVRTVDETSGEPVAGAAVVVRDDRGHVIPTAVEVVVTDAEGSALTPCVAFGDVEVVVRAEGRAPLVVPLTFRPGGTGTAEDPLVVPLGAD